MLKKIAVTVLLGAGFMGNVWAQSSNEHIIKNQARSYCRQHPEQCTPTYLMQKFPGSSVSRGNNGNCVNINIQNTDTSRNSRDVKVQNQLIMDDLTVVCD